MKCKEDNINNKISIIPEHNSATPSTHHANVGDGEGATGDVLCGEAALQTHLLQAVELAGHLQDGEALDTLHVGYYKTVARVHGHPDIVAGLKG